MKWVATTPLISLDTETTSKYPDEARVIDIAAAYVTPGQPLDLRQAYVNPGVPIPPESTEVHGLTDEFIEANGKPSAEVLDLYLTEIAEAMRAGAALVVQNARYDLTVLDREARRLGIPPLTDRLGGSVRPVVDPIVLDKRLIKYRSRVSEKQGPRVLKTLADIYGVAWEDDKAHGAAYDAVITARVLWKMAGWCALPRPQLLQRQTCRSATWKKVRPEDAAWFEAVGAMSPGELHEAQVGWAAEQAEGLAVHWQSQAAEKRELAGRDDPPGDEALDADERRRVLLDESAQLEHDAAGISTEWPLAVAA
ncbi:exonuclease domain-containing protein [Dactylosporangium sp. CA-139066]|uniref:exonuclease domain-containing protein n=1 Tax=Dactylosporangium sp. CA-139066 TaxID=3239930 RepID=UPI003D8EFC21